MRSWCDDTSNDVRSMFVACCEVPPKMATPKSSFLRLYLSFSVESMQPACKRHAHVRHAASSRDLYHMLGLVLYRSRYSA